MSYSKSPYRQSRGAAGNVPSSAPRSRAKSPFMAQPQQPEPQTFVFSELPHDEQGRFMDFLLSNDVEFAYDNNDETYVATIKIVNKPEENDLPQTMEYPDQDIVSGMD